MLNEQVAEMDEMRGQIQELEAFRTKVLEEVEKNFCHDGAQTDIKEFEDTAMQTEEFVDINAKKK